MKRRFLAWLAARVPTAVIRRDDGAPYLIRHYLFRTRWLSLYLHHMVASDPDPDLHDHPWAWALSWILDGGYDEELLVRVAPGKPGPKIPPPCLEYKILVRHSPWHFNLVRGSDFHRVHIAPERDAWTLFLVGPRRKDWGFLRPDGRKEVVTARLLSYARVR